MTVIGGVFWTEPASFDVGFEALAADYGQGGFVSGRIPVDSDWSLVAGVGVLGYKVDTEIGNDYYAKEPALMLGVSHRTDFFTLVARYIITESDKNHYVAIAGGCMATGSPKHPEEPRCR